MSNKNAEKVTPSMMVDISELLFEVVARDRMRPKEEMMTYEDSVSENSMTTPSPLTEPSVPPQTQKIFQINDDDRE